MSNVLLSNYHTHTARCNHASGSEEEYILRAIERGVRVLGFSDHSTHKYKTPFISACRMRNEEIDDYVSTLKALREKYRDKITIHIGFEVEYYPDTWEESLAHWKKHGIEYLILGQHFPGIEESGIASIFPPTENEDVLLNYTSLVTDGIKTGKISYLAHPDAGNSKLYESEMRKIIEAAIEYDVPLEYNLLGLSHKRIYPRAEFWALVKEYSPKIILGCDAHSVNEVAHPDTVATARKNLSALGITNIIDNLIFKPL